MASADEYREYAEQCMALASSASDISDKARLMQMAQAWRDLAGKLDAKQKQSGEKTPTAVRVRSGTGKCPV